MPELEKCPLKLFRAIKCYIHAGARNPVWKQVAELEALLDRPTEDALRARIGELEAMLDSAHEIRKGQAEKNVALRKRVGELEEELTHYRYLLSILKPHLKDTTSKFTGFEQANWDATMDMLKALTAPAEEGE